MSDTKHKTASSSGKSSSSGSSGGKSASAVVRASALAPPPPRINDPSKFNAPVNVSSYREAAAKFRRDNRVTKRPHPGVKKQ